MLRCFLFCFYALNFVFSSSIVFSSEGPQKRNRESTEAPEQKRTRSLSQYKKTLKGLREYISILPGVVMSEGTEYLLDHGVERSVPGYKSPIDHVFKPYYSPQRVLSGGVHVHRKYLQSFIKIGAIRKYYLYSKWENTLEPIAYTSTYEVNFICKKDSRSQLKVTYRDDHGTQKTDVYHLAIRQVNGQDQFYFELPVSD